MSKHKIIIGILFILYGAIFVLITAFAEDIRILAALILCLVGALHMFSGYSLIKERPWAHKFCITISAIALLSIPIGTVIGSYYFWYYYKIRKSSST